MEFFDNLRELLQATQDTNDNLRKNAEAQIEFLRD